MPPSVPLWWIVIPFFLWVIIALGHREAMRYARAARIVFGTPYMVPCPLIRGGEIIDRLYTVKINVHNEPYATDAGQDVIDAWAEVNLFKLDSTHIAQWKYPRWEENKQPGYHDHPRDYFPDTENVRTLGANHKPHILCVALRPVWKNEAHPFRGADQLLPHWRAQDIQIPPGEYLVRIRLNGKGLQHKAEHVLKLINKGANEAFDLVETTERVRTRW